VLAWGFGTRGLHRINARCFVRNPASGRVLAKLGMRHEGTAREHFKRWDRYEDVNEYGILQEEFERS
jgi:RimJ/RimL family protein N-acetyltransferase